MAEAASAVVEYDLGRTIHDRFRATLEELLASGTVRRVCEIGGGAAPYLTLDEVAALGVEYTVLDLSQEELDKAPDGYRKVVADITSRDLGVDGGYDLMFSRMVAEHVSCPQDLYRNVAALLSPGGAVVQLFPTLYAPPFVVNRILPERLAYRLLLRLSPHRANEGTGGKFPAYYRWCRGPTRRQLRRLRSTGLLVERFTAFFGTTSYFRRLPRLQRLEDRLAERLVRKPIPALTSYAIVTLRRPTPT